MSLWTRTVPDVEPRRHLPTGYRLMPVIARAVQRSPYWPVVTHPKLRRILPGFAISALGGGMSSVAVSWLALELAPQENRAVWVAAAIAANTLPGAVGAFTLGRWMNGRSGAQLAGWDALLRFVTLMIIPLVFWADALDITLFVVLLGVSSVLGAWGKAGRYSLLSELLDDEHRLPGNALINVILEASTVVGPLLAAVLIDRGGPATALGVVALTWGLLAATYRFALPGDDGLRAEVKGGASRSEGLRAIWRNRSLVGLLGLSFGFFLLFGPSSVAIPLLVVDDLHASAAVLAGFYTAFGLGAVTGAFLTGHLRRFPMFAMTIVSVLGFGLGMVPLGLGLPVYVCWVSFGLSGLFWGPFPTTTTTLFQDLTPPSDLPQVLAARGAVSSVATPLGTMAGAPLVLLVGAQGTLLVSALGLVGLGVCALLLALWLKPSAQTQGRLVFQGEEDAS